MQTLVATTRVILCIVAATLAAGLSLSAYVADPEAGRRKAECCAQCHGPNGNSTQATIPSLAGQPPLHTYYQLLQYRDKRRFDPKMSPEAAHLSDRDMQGIAAYYASQTPKSNSTDTDADKAALGKTISERHHCHSCHKPGLTGQNHIPRLAGQPYAYLVKQLRGLRAGTRPDIDGNMAMAAQPLSDQDIEYLAHYISALK